VSDTSKPPWETLTPYDVEYLFRGVSDDLARTEQRLRSLSAYFGPGTPESNKIEIAVSNVISARSYTHITKREIMPKLMPHRGNDGEHEHW
jgi:hypothetical protein